jgi:hypothetical protein
MRILTTLLDFEISIPDQMLDVLNQSTDYTWKRRPDGGIAAKVAVFHQLSCLVGPFLFLLASDIVGPQKS